MNLGKNTYKESTLPNYLLKRSSQDLDMGDECLNNLYRCYHFIFAADKINQQVYAKYSKTLVISI